MTTIPLKSLERGQHYVILAPDDILTLKELHSSYQQSLFERRLDSDNLRWRHAFETLERILKQIS